MAEVALVKCGGYGYATVKKAVRRAVSLIGGIEKFVAEGQTVLIKPNLIEPAPPEKGACTHPALVRAVVELVQPLAGKVWVGDASGGRERDATEKSFEASGLNAVLDETGAEKKNFQAFGTVKIGVAGGLVYREVPLFKPVAEADVVINLPKLKTHGLTFYTGAVKNMFGCVESGFRQRQHRMHGGMRDFSEALVDVFAARKPDLNIMDAVQAMEGNGGPCNGPLYGLGLLIASQDAVALDAAACEIIGYSALAIPTNSSAFRRGLGEARIGKISFVGERLQQCRVKDFQLSSLFPKRGAKEKRLFEPTLVRGRCVKCGRCETNCPVGAVRLLPLPEFDRRKCIRCFVCSEVCGSGAIRLAERPEPEKRVDLKLGYLCNNNCLFCVVADKKKLGDKSTGEAMGDLRLARKNNAAQVVFTGGEPTIRRDLPELVRYARKLGFTEVQVQSNGRMFCYKDFCRKMIDAGVTEFGPSLHGPNAEIHDSLTRSPGSFWQTVEGIKNLKGLGQKVVTNSVVTKQNYRHLPQLTCLLAGLGVDQAQLAFVHPLGNAGKSFNAVVPAFKEAVPYIRRSVEIAEKRGLRFMVEAVPYCLMRGLEEFVSEQYIPETEIREIGCYTENFSKVRKEEGKKKGPLCGQCRYFLVCEGPWKEYPQKMGFGEFKPVKGKRIRRLEELRHAEKNSGR